MATNPAAGLNHELPPRKPRRKFFKLPKPYYSRTLILVTSVLAIPFLFGVYRLLSFVPQPLDSPGTLRPILYALFVRFANHYADPEHAQDAWVTLCVVSLLIPTVLGLLNCFFRHAVIPASGWVQRLSHSRTVFFVSIIACFAICRAPSLLMGQVNPDEGLFLAAAHKLFRDPVFFRAVDCGTSGPFNVVPLMLPALFGISPDYASARVIALLLIIGSLVVFYRTFSLLADESLARIAILPAAGTFAAFRYGDFQHYSSECVSLLLLAFSVYICVRIFLTPQWHVRRLIVLGVLTGVAFLGKMQAVPIIGCVCLVGVAYIRRSGNPRRLWRLLLLFGLGLIVVLALNSAVCVMAGVWSDFWMEYIVANYRYTQSQGVVASQISRFGDFILGVDEIRLFIVTCLAIMAAYIYQSTRREPISDHLLFIRLGLASIVVSMAGTAFLRPDGSGLFSSAGLIAIAMVPGAFFFLYRDSEWESAPLRWFGFLTATVLASAIVAVYVAHHPFGHYLLLLVFPLTMVIAWPLLASSSMVSEQSSNALRSPSVPLILVFVTLILLRQFSQLGSQYFMAFGNVPSTVRTPEGEVIDSFSKPEDGIAVWGWDSRPYLSAGRVSATKDISTAQLFLTDGPVRVYYRQAYLNALRHHPPTLFVDAIGTSHGGFANRGAYGLELVPEIDSLIQSNYVHVLDAYKQRFYIRRDLARTVAGIGDPRKCDAQAIRCFEASAGGWIPADLPAIKLPEHALLEATFTPEAKQEPNATVFSNESNPVVHQGFQLVHTDGDRYLLAVGRGQQWARSKELLLPQRKPVSLAIAFSGKIVTIVCNGTKQDEMRLPEPMLDSPGPITVGGWMGHQRPFLGNIQFFQIRNLGQVR
jgi:hypothetical protein